MSEINDSNVITVPAAALKTGQRVIKITREGVSSFYPVGIIKSVNKYTPVIDHIYQHDIYDSVAYLDENNIISSVGWSGNAPGVIELWIASIDGTSSGNIVLQYAGNQTTVPVSGTVKHFVWTINNTQQGEIVIERLTGSDQDTLKDDSGNCITAIVADWQVW